MQIDRKINMDNLKCLYRTMLTGRKMWFCIAPAILLVVSLHNTAYGQRKHKVPQKELSIYDVDTMTEKPATPRPMWHNKIDKEQKRAEATFKFVANSEDTALANSFLNAITKEADHLQIMIENLPANGRDAAAHHAEKISALKALNALLAKCNNDIGIDQYYYKKRVANLHDLIIAENKGNITAFIQANVNVYTLDNIKGMYEKRDAPERALIYSEMGKAEPQMMIKRLEEFANEPYADNVISSAAKVIPAEVFNYASSTNYTLSNAVKRSKDPLVKTIVRIAQQSKAPLKALPFLFDIYTTNKTIEEIDEITSNPDLFFQNLVRLKVENVKMGGDTYTDELKYRGLKYVRTMNDLHEEKDAVRFRCIDGFSPMALYFIMVYGQDEIYTSSFLGTYRRMMERMQPMKGDQLLDTVHRDKFRTFIRMCAGYNTLGSFLATIDANKKNELMRDFISGLEKGKDDDLEDAVDVADAFGSIADPELSSYLQKQVTDNYERSYSKLRSKKGVIIYGLLATLFEGMKASENNDELMKQSERLNLPPINLVQNRNLVNDSGVIYEQFFFYGDEDGKNSYASFLGNFNFKEGKWKKVDNRYWTTITSTTGRPITIFANLPIPEPGDEEAQKALAQYLDSSEIHPTIVVHRGHSYHLPFTIDNLQKETKIVMLGSCGGYHNLGKVLERSPNAHIISSKQVGAMAINEPIIKAINDRLLAGNDINWVTTWKDLSVFFAAKKGDVNDKFTDYIPPHKNLGAIFIKAYRRMLRNE